MFDRGEILLLKEHVFGTTVWEPDLNTVADSLESHEYVTVLEQSDGYGWTCILTPRGKVGLVHKNNLRRSVQSHSQML